MSALTEQELDRIARSLNGRPRQTLGWLKPCEAFARGCCDDRLGPHPMRRAERLAAMRYGPCALLHDCEIVQQSFGFSQIGS